MTVVLDVIAYSKAPEDVADPKPATEKPTPSPFGVVLIHVAPSGRLDPSKPEDVEIVEGNALAEHLRKFAVD